MLNSEQEVQECFDPDKSRGRRNEADSSNAAWVIFILKILRHR